MIKWLFYTIGEGNVWTVLFILYNANTIYLQLGTSDPYLKCIHGQDKLFQTLEKKKTCNPMWAETFVSYVDNPFKPITLQVCCVLIIYINL